MTVFIIICMGVITWLLRFLPFVLVNRTEEGVQMSPFLERLPLAVLSAITVPGIFQVDEGNPLVGIAAGIVAVVLVLLKKVPLFGVIVVSVAAAIFVKLI